MGSDNKTKGSSSEESSEPSFFKSKIFVSLVLAVVFFTMGYLFAQSPKPSKSKGSKKGKGAKKN